MPNSDEPPRSDELWFEADTEAEDASGQAASAVLRAIAGTLSDAPESKRYDIRLVVEERDTDA